MATLGTLHTVWTPPAITQVSLVDPPRIAQRFPVPPFAARGTLTTELNSFVAAGVASLGRPDLPGGSRVEHALVPPGHYRLPATGQLWPRTRAAGR